MEQNQKYLKVYSWLVIAFTAYALVQLVVGAIMGLGTIGLDGVGLVIAIVSFVLSAVLLIPQAYVGLKGLAVAKNPTKGKAHIIVAFVLLILMFVGLLSAAVSFFQGEGEAHVVTTTAVEIFTYASYINYASKLRKELA